MQKNMMAAVLRKPGDIIIDEVAVPQVGPREVLIQVQRCGICGTDPHIFKGTFPTPLPLVQGHEFAGNVVQFGSEVKNIAEGDRVTADINISCGTCYYCRNGQKLFCSEIRQIGVHLDGAFAEYVKVPAENIYKLPDTMTWDQGAYIEPLACAIRGQERTKVTLGSTVAIIGGGSMGLLHALLAKMHGASTVILSELNSVRLEKARSLGVEHVVDGSKQDPIQVVRDLTDGRGADFVFEVVGAIPTYQQAFEMVRRGGTLVAYGAAPAGATMELKPFDIYSKELTVVGSYAGTYDTWLKAINLIRHKQIKPNDIISKVIPLNQVPEGILEAANNKDIVKIVVSNA